MMKKAVFVISIIALPAAGNQVFAQAGKIRGQNSGIMETVSLNTPDSVLFTLAEGKVKGKSLNSFMVYLVSGKQIVPAKQMSATNVSVDIKTFESVLSEQSVFLATGFEIPDNFQAQEIIFTVNDAVICYDIASGVFDGGDISWHVENDTVFITCRGKLSASAPEAPWEQYGVNSAVIGNGVARIGNSFFTGSKISSFILGEAVKNIGALAFSGCGNLVRMELKSRTPPEVGDSAFKLTPLKKAKLVVPAGTKAVYQKNKDWKKFGTIEEANE